MKMKTIVLAVLVAATPHTRATINRAFRPDHFEMLLAANLFEAVVVSARHRPDLLLLDLNQPLHKGWGIFENETQAESCPRSHRVLVVPGAADPGTETSLWREIPVAANQWQPQTTH